MQAKCPGSRSKCVSGGARCRTVLLGLASLGAVTWSGSARAQASSECYFNMMRMVDALPLAGQKQSTDEVTGNLHYLLSLPKGHDATKKWPVIVFMHGIGEVNPAGNMLNALTKHSLPRLVEDPAWNYPFIVVSPQIDNAGWLNHAAEIGAVFDRMIAEFGGDSNRLYLTGLSYGGVGTFSVGIALSERIAALMPVTPGGSVSNWAERAKIAGLPIWLFNGKLDNEYNANSQRVADLEASGASAFFKYDYAFADEYNDVAPQQALAQKHVFGSYDNIGHDVWHAAYGVYCPTLDAQKTTQYDWLLSQSKDGSAFVDPRDPNAGMGGSGGAAAGGAAAGGSGGGAGLASGGEPSLAGGGQPTAGGTMVGGSSSSGGTGTAAGFAPPGAAQSQSDASCSVGPTPSSGSAWWGLLLAGFALRSRKPRHSARH